MSNPPRKPDEIDLRVAARLRERRLALGLEARLLDAAVGETQGTVEKFENGTRRVGAAQLFRLGRILGVDVPYFFSGESAEATAGAGDEGASEVRLANEAQRFARAVAGIARPDVRCMIRALVETIAAADEPPEEPPEEPLEGGT